MTGTSAVVQCQQCKTQLAIVPPDNASSPDPNLGAPPGVSPRLEESFMLLEEVLGRHLTDTAVDESFIVLNSSSTTATHPHRPPLPPHSSAARQYTTTSASSSFVGNTQRASQHSSQHHQRFPLLDKMDTMARLLDLASEEACVDQPLCPDCANEVMKHLQEHVEDLEEEVEAYKALEQRLATEAAEGRGAVPMDDRTFQRALRAAQDTARQEETRLAETEAKLANAEARRDALAGTIAQLDQLEDRYWNTNNAVMLALHSAEDQRDALQSRIDAAERDITTLRNTNVLNDLFKIWFIKDSPLGTISGLRLGSVPDTPVEWSEINAAWGQAVLLLDTLARALHFTFPNGHRLEPRGSYPRVHDARGPNELFGPVNKMFSLAYDRAQVGFLQCLKALGEELTHRGALGYDGRPFALPYAINNDRVGDHSVRYTLSRDKAWTKALKYMLVDLKFCLRGTLVVLDQRRAAAAAPVSALPPEGPAAAAAAATL